MTDRSAFIAYSQRPDALPTKVVPLPELGEGESVRVRCLKQKERLRFGFMTQAASVAEENYTGPDPASYLVTVAAVQEDGTPMFSVQDAEWLAEFRGDVVEKIAGGALEVSGMTGESVADAEGKSEGTPSTDSPSNSPSDSDEPSPN